jgi:hypothetical protein
MVKREGYAVEGEMEWLVDSDRHGAVQYLYMRLRSSLMSFTSSTRHPEPCSQSEEIETDRNALSSACTSGTAKNRPNQQWFG